MEQNQAQSLREMSPVLHSTNSRFRLPVVPAKAGDPCRRLQAGPKSRPPRTPDARNRLLPAHIGRGERWVPAFAETTISEMPRLPRTPCAFGLFGIASSYVGAGPRPARFDAAQSRELRTAETPPGGSGTRSGTRP